MNPRPLVYRTIALPTELSEHVSMFCQGRFFQFTMGVRGIPSTLSRVHVIAKGQPIQIGHLNYHEMGVLALVRSNISNSPFANAK